MIAALYVATGGGYFGMPWSVDPWDEARDARLYVGPWPVVAHPPCQRWGRFYAGAPLVIKRTGVRKIRGDDGGCFEHALHADRTGLGRKRNPSKPFYRGTDGPEACEASWRNGRTRRRQEQRAPHWHPGTISAPAYSNRERSK